MTQKPNIRAFLFEDISDSSKSAFKRKAIRKLRLPVVLKRICGSGC